VMSWRLNFPLCFDALTPDDVLTSNIPRSLDVLTSHDVLTPWQPVTYWRLDVSWRHWRFVVAVTSIVVESTSWLGKTNMRTQFFNVQTSWQHEIWRHRDLTLWHHTGLFQHVISSHRYDVMMTSWRPHDAEMTSWCINGKNSLDKS